VTRRFSSRAFSYGGFNAHRISNFGIRDFLEMNLHNPMIVRGVRKSWITSNVMAFWFGSDAMSGNANLIECYNVIGVFMSDKSGVLHVRIGQDQKN